MFRVTQSVCAVCLTQKLVVLLDLRTSRRLFTLLVDIAACCQTGQLATPLAGPYHNRDVLQVPFQRATPADAINLLLGICIETPSLRKARKSTDYLDTGVASRVKLVAVLPVPLVAAIYASRQLLHLQEGDQRHEHASGPRAGLKAESASGVNERYAAKFYIHSRKSLTLFWRFQKRHDILQVSESQKAVPSQ